MAIKTGVILGSTRQGRAGKAIADWFMQKAQAVEGADIELIDLAEVDLPLFDEPFSPMMDNYQHDHTKAWSEQVSRYDGFILITPEYNHSTSAALKNALDYLNKEWKHKPVAFVGYGSMGGVRAIEHLRQITNELRMIPLRDQVSFTPIWEAVDQDGNVDESKMSGDPVALTAELVKFVEETKGLRA